MISTNTGNEISRVDGLTGLTRLTELVLDRNRIKVTRHLAKFLQKQSMRMLWHVHFNFKLIYRKNAPPPLSLSLSLQAFHERSFSDLVNLRVLLVEENR